MMRGIGVILVLISTMNYSVAQKSIATLLSAKGEAYVIRNRVKTEITVPYLFIYKDKVVVEKGDFVLLLCNSEEKALSSGDEYTFKDDIECYSTDVFDKILQESRVLSLENRSVISRSSKTLSLAVFPKSSKMIEGTDSEIKWQFNNSNTRSVSVVLYNMESEDVIYKRDSVTSNVLNLKGIDLKSGKHYYWIIKPDGDTEEYLGVVSVISETDIKSIKQFKLKTKFDFIRAYSYYADVENQFLLYDVLLEANYKYPDTELFRYLLKIHTGFDVPLYNTKNPNRKF